MKAKPIRRGGGLKVRKSGTTCRKGRKGKDEESKKKGNSRQAG